MNENRNLSMFKAAIVGHVFTSGPCQELENFLKRRVKELIFVGHPFSFSERSRSFFKIHKNGMFIDEYETGFCRSPGALSYLIDFFLTIALFIKHRKTFDLFIGADGLNAFCGLLLRKIGLTRIVIFYVIDYVPNRFHNTLLNGAYHWLDRVCVKYCDYVWNLSPWMAEERERRGISKSKTAPQLVVPIGTNFSEINRLYVDSIERRKLVFLGHLLEDRGVQLAIKAFPKVIQKVPDAFLVIIGKGEYEGELKNIVREKGLDEHVSFLGEVKSHSEVERILTRCAIGLAPYVPEPSSYKQYTDPGKIKAYMGCGLPVIVTKVPRIAYDLERLRVGIAINYDREEMVEAITRLLTDDSLYREYRENAIKFASEYDWNTIFSQAIHQLLS